MLSFEFSAFDLVLSVCVMVLIVLFVTTLLKLKPSNENRQPPRDEVYEEEQESALLQHQPTVPPVSWQNGARATPQKTQRMPQLVISATAEGTSHESLEQKYQPSESRDPPKQPKTTTSAKQISKSSEDKDCLHHFGYLNGLPKNTPIPGECFGCPKIVDCLITAKAR
jgi:hypothetical protein